MGLALGTMRLPALLLIGVAAPTAAGTNIMVSALASLTGALRHLREGRVNLRIVLVMGVPAFAGAFIGGFGSGRVSESLLILLAGLLVFWQGIELIARVRPLLGTRAGNGPGSSGSLQGVPGHLHSQPGVVAVWRWVRGGPVGWCGGTHTGQHTIARADTNPSSGPADSGGDQPIHRFLYGLCWVGRPRCAGPGELPSAVAHGRQRNGRQLLRGQTHRPGEPG